MTYVASVSVSYNRLSRNEYTRLINALVQAGWEYADTQALVYDSDDLDGVLLALEVLAKAVTTPGELSALNLQVHLVGGRRPAPGADHHRQALRRLLDEPLPSEHR